MRVFDQSIQEKGRKSLFVIGCYYFAIGPHRLCTSIYISYSKSKYLCGTDSWKENRNIPAQKIYLDLIFENLDFLSSRWLRTSYSSCTHNAGMTQARNKQSRVKFQLFLLFHVYLICYNNEMLDEILLQLILCNEPKTSLAIFRVFCLNREREAKTSNKLTVSFGI